MMLADATRSGDGGHPFWHLLVLAGASVAVFAALKVWEWWRSFTEHRNRRRVAAASVASDISQRRPWAHTSSPLIVVVALASAGCSVTHAAVGPAHFHEATAFGVFFVVAAALQAVWALLVLRRADRELLGIGAVGNAALLGLWALTRTLGLPVGPEIWRPEPIAATDLFASALEVTIVLGAAWLLLRHAEPEPTKRDLSRADTHSECVPDKVAG
jgi:hypothetical protein